MDSKYDPIAWLGRKILRHPSPTTAAEAARHTGATAALDRASRAADGGRSAERQPGNSRRTGRIRAGR